MATLVSYSFLKVLVTMVITSWPNKKDPIVIMWAPLARSKA